MHVGRLACCSGTTDVSNDHLILSGVRESDRFAPFAEDL